MIPYARQHVDEDDIDAVVEVLRGDWLTQGPSVAGFEAAVAERVGASHAVSFANGTAALHGAAAAGGLGRGDLVAVPAMTFAASANCARYVGADVDLIDIDPATMLGDLASVGGNHDGLVAVHFAGLAQDLSAMPTRPRVVIEDAAHALGAVGPHGPVGNCAHSDMCVFSFHPVKSIAAGEGGLVTTNSSELADRMRRFRNHGMNRDHQSDPWAYGIDELGFNYRLSDIHAALGLSQLGKLDSFIERRNVLASRYDVLLADLPVICPPGAAESERHARHLYPIRVSQRRQVFDGLRDGGIGVQVHYVPLHRLGRFSGHRHGSLEGVDRVADEIISLPLFPDLTGSDQERVVAVLGEVLDSLGIVSR